MKRLILFALFPLLMAATTPAGPQPANYQNSIDKYYAQALRDPTSVMVYRVSDLFETTQLSGFKKKRVWVACVQINAKNAYGAYTGIKTDAVFFDGDTINLVYEAWRVLVHEKCPEGKWQDRDKAGLMP